MINYIFICFIFAAQSLIEFGESLKQMADVKYSLDDNIKQNVLEPLHHLQTKDLKEVMVIRLILWASAGPAFTVIVINCVISSASPEKVTRSTTGL